MNKVIETILQRRSVRDFEQKKIDREILNTLLTAASAAPSGANSQPWRFVVVENDAFLKKLADIALPNYKKWMEKAPEQLKEMRKEIDAVASDPVYYSAPAVIFVIGKGMTSDFDCSMACQNIMLAARSFDIGSCWVFFGQLVLGDAEVRNAFGLTEGEKVYGPIVLGYPKSDFPAPQPKKPIEVKWI